MLKKVLVVWLVAGATCLLMTIGCWEDCSPAERLPRGTFAILPEPDDYEIYGYWENANGTMEIREDEVEIVYQDEAGETWTVLYDIVEEFPAGEGSE